MKSFLLSIIMAFVFCSGASYAQPVSITLLHTNDLHSHFRADHSALPLGGVARLKTAIQKIRDHTPNTVLIDGGDWSEGNIYYTLGAGRESLRLMDMIGYDVAVVGNHDWLNGPDALLRALDESHTRTALIAANLGFHGYLREQEFKEKIPPYILREVGGVKIAFIGLATYEFIYDQYFTPIRITEPFVITRELSERLKKQEGVQLVIAVSHNRVSTNQAILKAAPQLDLIIGAHDHQKLSKPVQVQRTGARTGWIVEAGCWGRYLGQVDLEVDPDAPTPQAVVLKMGKLLQIDSNIPEDPKINRYITSLEEQIERSGKGLPSFHEHVGETHLEITRQGMENLMGNLTADSYLSASGAQAAIESNGLVYGELHRGALTAVDVFNSNPAIYNPEKGKSWTLHVLPIGGKTLRWMLNFLFVSKVPSAHGFLFLSGMKILYDFPIDKSNQASGLHFPHFLTPDLRDPQNQSIKKVWIQGQPLEDSTTYRMALSGGVIEALRFLNSYLPNAVPLDNLLDTGAEDWRVMKDYIQRNSPLTSRQVAVDSRLQSVGPDLGLLYDDVTWTLNRRSRTGVDATVHAVIHNYGASSSAPQGMTAQILVDQHGANTALDPDYREAAPTQSLPALESGQSVQISWNVTLTEDRGIYPVTIRVQTSQPEINSSNNEVVRWFTPEERQ